MKCETCPVSGPVCTGANIAHLCTLARTREDYRHRFVVLAGEAPGTRSAAKQSGHIPTPEERSRVDLCPHRECRTGCLLSRCRIGRRGERWAGQEGTDVTIFECIDCLKSL